MKKKLQIFSFSVLFTICVLNVVGQTVYTVTKTTDPDSLAYPYSFEDENCAPEMLGTLQWAIRKANDTNGDCIINFDIEGATPHIIGLNEYLPVINSSCVIDGTSQTGYDDNSPAIIISPNTSNVEYCFYVLGVDNIEIKGLSLQSFIKEGIIVDNSNNAIISKNIISLINPDGSSNKNYLSRIILINCTNSNIFDNILNSVEDYYLVDVPNNYGITLLNSENCIIGSESASNTISYCYTGVFLDSSQNIKITRNSIFEIDTPILLNNPSNNNKKETYLFKYNNSTLKGVAEPNDIIEIFGADEENFANTYLGTSVADENGQWFFETENESPFFTATATNYENNTSECSNYLPRNSPCNVPYNLSCSSGIDTTHVLSWESYSDSVEFHLIIGIDSISPVFYDDWKFLDTIITQNYITINGFDENIVYDFYVNEICENGESHWEGPVKINRACVSPHIRIDVDTTKFVDVSTTTWYPSDSSGGGSIASHYTVCKNSEIIEFYNLSSYYYILNGREPFETHWWCGGCDQWDSSQGTSVYFCLEPEEDPNCNITTYWSDEYGSRCVFDPSIHEPGTYIINAQHNTCRLHRVYITVLESQDPTIEPAGPFCDNDDIVQLNSASYGGIWEGTGIVDATAGTFSPALAGEGAHTVIHSFADTCPTSDTITIIVHKSPNPAPSVEPVCVGESAFFYTPVEISTGTIYYHWEGPNGFTANSNSFTLENVQNYMQGTYTVTVSEFYNDGTICTSTESIEFSVLPTPTVNITPNQPVICDNNTVILDAGTWDEYIWSTEETTQTIEANQPNQTYSVTVTNTYGCTGEDSVHTIESNIGIKGFDITDACEGLTNGSIIVHYIYGGTPAYSISWTGPNGFTANSQSIYNIGSGLYTIYIEDANGCTLTETFEVLEIDSPEIEIISDFVCEGDLNGTAEVVVINPVPNETYTYEWSNGETTPIATLSVGPTHYVTVTNQSGCYSVEEVQLEEIEIGAVFKYEPCLNLDQMDITSFIPIEIPPENYDNYTYEWVMGDGTVFNTPTVTPEYEFEGFYCPQLTVSYGQCSSTYQERVYVFPSECYCDANSYDVENVYINLSNYPSGYCNWDDVEMYILNDMIVDGVELVVKHCKLHFGPKGRLIIKQNGYVKSVSTVFTSFNNGDDCNHMWQGIEVWGNGRIHQFGSTGKFKGVYPSPMSVIENAHIGILLGARNMNYSCNVNTNQHAQPFDLGKSNGYCEAAGIQFINNGVDIRFCRNIEPGQAYNNSIIRDSKFLCNPQLLDDGYNIEHQSPYGFGYTSWGYPNGMYFNPRNPWAARANSLQRSAASILSYNMKFSNKIKDNMFSNKERTIETYNSKFDVHACTFKDTYIGIGIFNFNTSLNSSHNIDECYFYNIPGIEGEEGAGIFIIGGLYDNIHDNIFGNKFYDQDLNSYGIITWGASRFKIIENEFTKFQNVVWAIESGTGGGFIGAGISNDQDYEGNIFTECNKNIITTWNNQRLKLRCNMCWNDENDLYTHNFETSGILADQGYHPPNLNPFLFNSFLQRHGAGNEFSGGAYHDRFLFISQNSGTQSYKYYHHTNIETTPEVDQTGTVQILPYSIGVAKSSNSVACRPLFFVIPIAIDYIPWQFLSGIDYRIDNLYQNLINIKYTFNDITNDELIEDIQNNSYSFALKEKLLENSPLHDTVIKSLLIEYPLSHYDFKTVMSQNMPVSKDVEPYLFERLLSLPTGISQQLYPLQVNNQICNTIRSLQDKINFLKLEKQLITNEIVERLINDDNRLEDAKTIIEYENLLSSKQILHSTNFSSDYTGAMESLMDILDTYEQAEDWVNLQLLQMSLQNENKTFFNMDSLQLEFVRELALKCPPDLASANARAIMFMLFGENLPTCEIMDNKNSIKLVKDIDFRKPLTDAYIEDNFPDPFTDNTQIDYYIPEGAEGKIIISDIYGRIILEKALKEGENSLKINTNGWKPGVYTYGLYVDNKMVEFKKMVKTQ